MIPIREIDVTRYILALREGGSLPALAEASDGAKYVIKFCGAGQGTKALIAEFLGGEIARKLGLNVPEIVFVHLAEGFGRTQGDEEIQDLLKFSQGLNLALGFMTGAVTYDAAVNSVDGTIASRIVWLDAFITNVDRTYRNTNMMLWNKELWLIDHGAAFYFHHSWTTWAQHAVSTFALIKDHVLLPHAAEIGTADQWAKSQLDENFFKELVESIPDVWLQWEGNDYSIQEKREVYFQFLCKRLEHSEVFIKFADDTRQKLI